MSLSKIKAEPYEFTFDPTTTALVIIDMQRDFVEPEASVKPWATMCRYCARRLLRSRKCWRPAASSA